MIKELHIITTRTGEEILVTVWAEGGIEAAPRIDYTRWGAPLPTREESI